MDAAAQTIMNCSKSQLLGTLKCQRLELSVTIKLVTHEHKRISYRPNNHHQFPLVGWPENHDIFYPRPQIRKGIRETSLRPAKHPPAEDRSSTGVELRLKPLLEFPEIATVKKPQKKQPSWPSVYGFVHSPVNTSIYGTDGLHWDHLRMALLHAGPKVLQIWRRQNPELRPLVSKTLSNEQPRFTTPKLPTPSGFHSLNRLKTFCPTFLGCYIKSKFASSGTHSGMSPRLSDWWGTHLEIFLYIRPSGSDANLHRGLSWNINKSCQNAHRVHDPSDVLERNPHRESHSR
ncbi:predicted protein [Histoplasma capsulatum var. duboisii H88]|uniref:Predicted protein n=1 Tax=Ajellomyces capsulatus (strain H88) TaxID=544711 RepID=F0UGJ1_AJEC8|nr:predicted protein [Histoplasma capsulatum var. duboisii H88]